MNKRRVVFAVLAGLIGGVASASADSTYVSPLGSAIQQNWSDGSRIQKDDIWSGVVGFKGFRGDTAGATPITGRDPRTVTSPDDPGVTDVNPNRNDPDAFTTGGVTEFDAIANSVVALNGSGTADFPYLKIYLNASLTKGHRLRYTVRDLDGSVDNAIQQVVAQYRIGDSGFWTNIDGTYIADATDGPSLSGRETSIVVDLPEFNNAPKVEIRIITTNAVGNDEWIGIDDISITGSDKAHFLPSLSMWGMMALASVLLMLGTAYMVRRRTVLA